MKLQFIFKLTELTVAVLFLVPAEEMATFSDDSECLLGHYFDDQKQKCVQVVSCNEEGHCPEDGSVCNWNYYCEPAFCTRTSDCAGGRTCIFSHCMENTKHLCDVRDEVCTVDLPHKASDYDDCTVIKHYFSGTKEEVTIDSANNCFYIKRVPRTLDAIYTFSCAKGDHEVYSYINIELRDKASGPEIEMPPPPYFKGGTYNIICSMRRLLQEPKYYEVTIGGINCTTSFSYNKTSETASVLCQKRFSEFDDNKILGCSIKPRHELEKRTEGDIIVLTKPTILPLYSEDSGQRRLTSEQIDNKNDLPTPIPADVRDDTHADVFVEISRLSYWNDIMTIATFVILFLIIVIGWKCYNRCKKTKEEGNDMRSYENSIRKNFSSVDIHEPNQAQGIFKTNAN